MPAHKARTLQSKQEPSQNVMKMRTNQWIENFPLSTTPVAVRSNEPTKNGLKELWTKGMTLCRTTRPSLTLPTAACWNNA
jgi:hypothetical protein